MHYSQELESAEGDFKSTCKVINKMINKGKPHNNIHLNNQELTNSSEIANAFNSFFTSIGPD